MSPIIRSPKKIETDYNDYQFQNEDSPKKKGKHFAQKNSSVNGPTAFQQLAALSWKNSALAQRRRGQTFCLVFTPVFITLVMLLLQYISIIITTDWSYSPAPKQINEIPKCFVREGNYSSFNNLTSRECISFIYAPVNVKWVKDVMNDLGIRNDLKLGTDILSLPGASDTAFDEWCWDLTTPAEPPCMKDGCVPCRLLEDEFVLDQFLIKYPNYTQGAVIFHSAYYPEYYNVS